MSTDEPIPPPPPHTPPPSGPDYGAPPPGGGYGAPPPGGYGTPPGGGYGGYGDAGSGGYGGGGYGGGGYGGYGVPPGGAPEERWSVGNALAYGWRKFAENLGPIFVLSLILFVGVVVFGIAGAIVQSALASSESGLWAQQSASAVFSLLNFFISTLLGGLVVRGALALTEGRRPEIGSILGRIDIGQLLLLAIISAVITAVGFLLCIIPGLVAMLFFYFATYFLVDRRLSAVDSLKASVNLVRGRLGDTLLWAIVAVIVSAIGLCLCGVGLLITYPLAIIATAYSYKRFTGQPVAP
jgi:uncharacterized membrane protein